MNEVNVIGLDLEKYNDHKPTQDIRRKIRNFINEFEEAKDFEIAKESFEEICYETKIQRSYFAGYILQYAYSYSEKGFKEIMALLIDYLHLDSKVLSANDMVEG
jgi:ribosomal protein S17E